MEQILKDLKQNAYRHGACSLINEIKDAKSLVDSFFSPQGLEFCEKFGFPTIELFRNLKELRIEKLGVFIDAGQISKAPDGRIALIGNTEAEIHCSGTEHIFHIVLAHGAEARITATNYAVVKIYKIGKCECTIDIDETSVLL